jgi:uncharacterized protein (DUF1697 family)
MTTRIALLTAVNVGGKNKLSMAELRHVAGELGFENPQTVLQTGNLIFRSEHEEDGEVEELLESEIEKRLELKTYCVVRQVSDLESLVLHNPFPHEAVDDPSHLVTVFFRAPISEDREDRLRAVVPGREYFKAVGRELVIVYPDGIGDSKVTKNMIDSKVGQRGTARNWNTVLKLLDSSSRA